MDASSVYAFVLRSGVLLKQHSLSLKKDRGFTDETIRRNKFFSSGKHLAVLEKELIANFPIKDLVESGVIDKDSESLCSQLLSDNIIIPYLTASGEPVLLRPHKYGLSGVGVQIYQELNFTGENTLIIAEGEFKAAAAVQLGFQAIALPGISSFASTHYDQLKKTLSEHGIKSVYILFDNEIKDDPSFKNYKPKPSARWDTHFYAYLMAKMLSRDGFSALVAWLPDAWREQGKADIDGALASGKTRKDFDFILGRAKTSAEFYHALPHEAQLVVRRKEQKRFLRSNVSVDFGHYVAKRKRGKTIVHEQISNFTIQILATHETRDGIRRTVKFINDIGDSVVVSTISAEQMSRFREFCLANGNFLWDGTQDDLSKIWQLLFLEDDGRHIIEPDHVGWIDEKQFWMFNNVIVGSGLELRPEDGIFWTEKHGYKPIQLADTAIVPEMCLSSDITFPEVLKNLSDTFGENHAKVCLGWVISVAFFPEVFDNYACFPFLFLHGKKGSGKSHIADWLMGFFGIERGGRQASDSTTVGLQRCLEYYSCLPIFVDEYKNVQKVTAKDGFFRNVYNRQGASKGTRDAFGIRQAKIRGTILFSGEETPHDPALLSRCVPIMVDINNRTTDRFDWFSRNFTDFSYLFINLLRKRKEKRDDFLKLVVKFTDEFRSCGCDSRMSINYAIVTAGYTLVFGEDLSLGRWLGDSVTILKTEQEEDSTVADFFSDISVLIKKKQIPTSDFFCVSDGKLFFWFRGVYNSWCEYYRKLHAETPFRSRAIINLLRVEKGFLSNTEVKKINGSTYRTISFDICNSAEYITDLVSAINDLPVL